MSGAGAAPLYNMGVAEENFRGPLIDYLRYSVAWELGVAGAVPDKRLLVSDGRTLYPLRFYDNVYPLAAGRADWHGENRNQKLLVTFAGNDCEWLRDNGLMEACLSHGLYADGGNVTRLDIAWDVFREVDLMQIVDDYRAGEVQTAAHSVNVVGGYAGAEDIGATVYIGSRASERFVRIYDKGRKEGVGPGWVRVELELKGDRASLAAKEILISGMSACGAILRDFLVLPYEWYERAIEGVHEVGLPFPERESDRLLWYKRQVLPNLMRDVVGGSGLAAWLRGELSAVLAISEGDYPVHGGVVSEKRRRGIGVLEECGLAGATFRAAFEGLSSEEFSGLMLRFGFVYEGRRWVRL